MSIELPPGLAARAAVHAALGDPHRLAIVDALVLSDRAPSELADLLGIGSNLVAHHIKVLEEVGLIERLDSAGDRRRRYLRLRRPDAAAFAPADPIVATSVVFVCTHNSARSQLAAALWNESSPVPALSAGTHPAERVHPFAVAAGDAAGLDLSGATPRHLDELPADPDLIVTVCDRAHEELAPGGLRLHWSVPDPSRTGRRRDFDRALSRIADRVRNLSPIVIAP